MRVLLVNDHRPGATGGVERHVDRLARALREHGDEVELFAGEVAHHGLARTLDVWDPWARRALGRRAAAFRPDVVHVHNFQRELSPSVFGAGGGGVPTVVTVNDHRLFGDREGALSQRRGLLDRARQGKAVLERAVVRRHADALIAVSDELAARLRGAGFERVHTIRNFAEPPAVTSLPSETSDIAYVGRLSAEKGVDVLIRAWSQIAPSHPRSVLRIAGDGPEASRLRRLVDEVENPPVTFEGLLEADEVEQLLSESRLVCAPSTRRTEGLPLAALEGMLAGRPLVATRSRAFAEVVRDGVDGYLVPIGDVAALAHSMAVLLGSPGLADSMGDAGRARALAEFATSACVPRIRAVYLEALDRHGGRA